ncbi:hypothetical protein B0H11DRAFT_1732945, partial [Mycena galericulata]
GPVVPANAPPWLAHAIGYLTDVDLGPHFEALLEAWVQVEVAYGFDTNPLRGLPSAGRPRAIEEWIKSGRGKKNKKRISIGEVEAYRKSWQAWWDSMQPDWRTKDADGRYPAGGDHGSDWASLDFPGQNGTLSVVAGLFFWGSARYMLTELPVNAQEDWEAAVLDVAWMLEGLQAWISEV